MKTTPLHLQKIEKHIFRIRGKRVLLDYDLAALYQVQLKVLLQSIRRNPERFPVDFMFRLTVDEYRELQKTIDISQTWGGRRTPPNAFAEQGVAMLSSVLSSKAAIAMNVEIMRAFTRLRTLVEQQTTLLLRLDELDTKVREHDHQIQNIIEVIRSLVSQERQTPKQIGFNRSD